MKKNLNFDFKAVLPRLKKLQKQLAAHRAFITILAVLLAYVFILWQINRLATAEPSPDALSATNSTSSVPSIDSNAIKQIQTLEQNSPSVHVLLQAARNNPFQE